MNDAIVHASGLVFERPASYGSLNHSRLDCFGQLLNDPQFRTLTELESRFGTLDSVRLTDAFYVDATGNVIKDEQRKAVVSNVSGRSYEYVSNGYRPVHDADVFRAVVDVARENEHLTPIGRIDGVGTGQTRGHVIFASPEFRVRLLEEYNEDIMLGVMLSNSYNGTAAVRMQVFGVRMVCVNYNLWGRLLGMVYQPHININPEKLTKDVSGFISTLAGQSSKLRSAVKKAYDTVVLSTDVEDLLWGIKMPKTLIDKVSFSPASYCPEVNTYGLNAWTLYNAVTGYLTWEKKDGAEHYDVTIKQAYDAVSLLSENHNKLLEKGQELKDAYLQRLAGKAVERRSLVKVVEQ